VQTGVDVDGGNLSVELGSVTPLPANIWGRQLYLGVQVAGDSEMSPRPALTAAPYALRAAGTMQRTLVVSAEGTPSENGAALLAAVATITDATATSPVVVEVDAGTFDLGTASLVMPSDTVLAGRGQTATVITSAVAAPGTAQTVLLSPRSAARDLTARNTGVPPGNADSAVGIGAFDPLSFTPITDVLIERVTGESIAATGTPGQRAGITVCSNDSVVRDVTAVAVGGLFAMALRGNCEGAVNVVIDGATLLAEGARDGVRGTYLTAGPGNEWRRIRVNIQSNSTAETVFGIRVLANASGQPGASLLQDSSISIRGSNITNPTSTTVIEGLRVEDFVDVEVNGLIVAMDNVRAAFVSGARLIADPASPLVTRIVNADFEVKAVQDAAQQPGSIWGIRAQGAAPALQDVRITVDCLAGGFNTCFGVYGDFFPGNPAIPVNTMLLDQTRIEVGHRAPADSSAQSVALEAVGIVQVQNSSLKVRVSPANELAVVFGTNSASARMQLLNSNLILDNPATPNGGCASRGTDGSVLELFGNHIQGNACAGAGVTQTCAGNTRRGGGFLASTCQ
jgi:hypothetical protein